MQSEQDSKRSKTSEVNSSSVRINNLTKKFSDLIAVNSVSFEIEDGEFFTLVGPSGCGKTTLLRMLAGLETATDGSIVVGDQDITNVPAEKRPTSMVFQHLALFPYKNVYENLTFGLKMQGISETERRERASEMLSVLGLEEYGNNEIEELSGGEQQRVALGRSLLPEPDILLLDEPLASLDVKLRKEMQLELRRVHSDLRSTFFYVTHDQQVALTASDRIGVMRDGNIIQVGTPREIYEEPATPFVAEFIGESNLRYGQLSYESESVIYTDEGHTIRVSDRQNLAEGDVCLSIRPEQITIAAEPIDADNVFEGAVVDRIYQGEDIVYQVNLDDDQFRVHQPAKESRTAFEEGEAAYIGWNIESAYVIAEDVQT